LIGHQTLQATVLHRARQPLGERLHRKLQWETQGWTTQWRDLHHSARGQGVDRLVETAV